MPMKNLAHPGRILRMEYLNELALSVTDAANALGVSRQALNNVVNEKAALSPEMAIRLSKAFGSSPEFWMRLQFNYDLAGALKNEKKIKVDRIFVSRAAESGSRARPKKLTPA